MLITKMKNGKEGYSLPRYHTAGLIVTYWHRLSLFEISTYYVIIKFIVETYDLIN